MNVDHEKAEKYSRIIDVDASGLYSGFFSEQQANLARAYLELKSELDAEIEAALAVVPTEDDKRVASELKPLLVGGSPWSRLYGHCNDASGARRDLRVLRHADANKDAEIAALKARLALAEKVADGAHDLYLQSYERQCPACGKHSLRGHDNDPAHFADCALVAYRQAKEKSDGK